jgi:hypothetical protein
LEEVIERDLEHCSDEQRTVFAKHRVPFFQVAIHRFGQLESVYVVARFGKRVLYYEDVEDGFALTELDNNGEIAEQDCGQWELSHVLHQLAASGNDQ